MDTFEKHLHETLKRDLSGLSANTAIKQRLMYHMQIQSSQNRIRQNSIIPSIGHFILEKFTALKLGIAAMLLIAIVGYKQFNQNNTMLLLSDTTCITQPLDTLNVLNSDSTINN